MKYKYLLLALLGFISINVFAQGPTTDPLCAPAGELIDPETGEIIQNPETSYNYQNSTNIPNANPAWSANSYGCLGTEPNPSFFYLQVADGGSISFTLAQVSDTGNPIDVDFICWGPFPAGTDTSTLYGPTVMNAANTVACSYSAAAIENFTIPNAQAGEIYILLVTNFSNQPGTIYINQTGGIGSTDCDISCPLDLGADIALCEGNTAIINSNITDADTYAWFFNGDPVLDGSGQPVDTSSITVSEWGTYTVVINRSGCPTDTSDSLNVIEPAPMNNGLPDNLGVCSSDPGPYIFDLTVNTPVVLNGQNEFAYLLEYFASEDDMINEAPIPDPANYEITDITQPTTIYIRLYYYTL